MSDLEHLSPEIWSVMQRPTAERIEFAEQDHWIGYSRARQALAALQHLLRYPRILRMPNLLLVGESGNGKSTIVERFRVLNPVQIEAEGNARSPVVVMVMPPGPVETRFWSELLNVLQIGHRETDPVQRKKSQAQAVLQYLQCRLLVIDEVHNIQHGHARQQRQFLSVLKNLSNDLKLPIVAVGTREAIRTLHTDTQLSSRFEAFDLPRWQLGPEFISLLGTYERLLPLAYPSGLMDRELAVELFNMSGGTIGGLTRVLKRATAQAIETKHERIDRQILKAIHWVRLSDYGDQGHSL